VPSRGTDFCKLCNITINFSNTAQRTDTVNGTVQRYRVLSVLKPEGGYSYEVPSENSKFDSGKGKNVSLLQNIQTSFGAHPAFFSMGTEGFLPEGSSWSVKLSHIPLTAKVKN
jgi:hypothetical protein